MNSYYYIFIVLLFIASIDSHRYFKNLNKYLHLHERDPDTFNGKFGSPRQHLYRLMPLYYSQQLAQDPPCLPHVWTCGPGLPPCCPGLMCYDGNAKRGRQCVAKG